MPLIYLQDKGAPATCSLAPLDCDIRTPIGLGCILGADNSLPVFPSPESRPSVPGIRFIDAHSFYSGQRHHLSHCWLIVCTSTTTSQTSMNCLLFSQLDSSCYGITLSALLQGSDK